VTRPSSTARELALDARSSALRSCRGSPRAAPRACRGRRRRWRSRRRALVAASHAPRYGDGEGRLPSARCSLVVGREGHLERALLAGAGADQPLLEAGTSRRCRARRADHVLAPSIGSPSIVPAKSITTKSPRAADLHRLESREPLAGPLELAFDVLLGDRRLARAPRGRATHERGHGATPISNEKRSGSPRGSRRARCPGRRSPLCRRRRRPACTSG